MKLKSVQEQVAVVMGGSGGIGRETALRFAERGAKVVVAARREPGLASVVEEIAERGGEATYVLCDVANFTEVENVADIAVRTFGRIDTWVNAAAQSLNARFEDTTPEEFRRVSEVNYLGQVHGALAALPHLRRAGQGAIIAISSVESIVALPLHSAYSASKHAVEGAMDALRRDLMAQGAPISVTSVKPGSVDTSFFAVATVAPDRVARNSDDVPPQAPPPDHQVAVVADCVMYAAEHPVRDLFAGGTNKLMALSQVLAPRQVDATLARIGHAPDGTLHPRPSRAPDPRGGRAPDDRGTGDVTVKTQRFSLYTWWEIHPKARAAATAGMLLGAPLVVTRLLRGARTDGSVTAR
jgi:NAD(P)-dependent dehydrogenase (short-subunit alcohol dehydrogenase family)